MFGCGWPSISGRTYAILYFSFLSLQVANSCNCHFSCRAVYLALALEQVVPLCCPWPVFTVIEFLDFFIFELLPLPFHSVICLCHPVFSLAAYFCLFADSCQDTGALCGFMYLGLRNAQCNEQRTRNSINTGLHVLQG